MLPDSFRHYREYLSDLGLRNLPEPMEGEEEISIFRKLHKSTQERFGFEWLRYEVTDSAENTETFYQTTGFRAADLAGKRVLDAGCGMGRYLEVAASYGAEVVGMDLSVSVERAWRETAYRPQVHLIQGDILKPPLRPQTFDFIYSIGVLHHTPDPRRAFGSLCPRLRDGGRISIWVYPTFQSEMEVGFHKRIFAFLAQSTSNGIRLLTTRMPRLLLHYLCYAAVPLGWLKNRAYRSSIRRKIFWPVLLLPISAHEKWQVRLCDTFDWLAPKFQFKYTTREIFEWFAAEGLTDVVRLERAVSATGVRLPRQEAEEKSLTQCSEREDYAFRQS